MDDSQLNAFEKLKTLLTNAPILHLPDFSRPFVIATDASLTGIGAVLMQLNDKNEKNYISFQNRALSASERNYSATKRELLAIIFALKKFHYYIYGTQFQLLTDHKALTFIFTQKQTNAMILSWLETLLSYTFTIKHLPGVQNILPDHLSHVFAASASILAPTLLGPASTSPALGSENSFS